MQCPKCKADIDGGSAVCSQCGHSLKNEPPLKTNWLAALAASCIIAAVVAVFLLFPLAEIDVDGAVTASLLFCICGLLAASPVLGILALLRIYRSNNTLGGKRLAVASIIVSSILLAVIAPAVSGIRNVFPRIFCGMQLEGLGKATLIYANDNDDMLPTPENWCDWLITQADVTPKQFRCIASGARYGESSYALNKNAAGMKVTNLPPDMVLLFEAKYENESSVRDFPITSRAFAEHYDYPDFKEHLSDKVYKLRWNQVGGPDSLTVDNHKPRGSLILFVDSHVEFVEPNRLPKLRWKIEGEEVFPADLFSIDKGKSSTRIPALMLTGLLVLAVTAGIFYKYWAKQYILFSLILGLIAGVAGCFFGFFANPPYQANEFRTAGIIAGGVLGLVCGICYALILANTPSSIKEQRGFKGYAVSSAMAAGVIFSIIVYLFAMMLYQENMLFGMITRMPFAILVGALLGWLSSIKMNRYLSQIQGGA